MLREEKDLFYYGSRGENGYTGLSTLLFYASKCRAHFFLACFRRGQPFLSPEDVKTISEDTSADKNQYPSNERGHVPK